MDLFNIIAGLASIISLGFSLFATNQVKNIKKQLIKDNSNRVGTQLTLGSGNKVAGRDMND